MIAALVQSGKLRPFVGIAEPAPFGMAVAAGKQCAHRADRPDSVCPFLVSLCEPRDDGPAAFERAVRIAVENREFWRSFTDVPDIDMDTAAIVRAWSAARDAVLTILRAKAAAPLDAMELPPACLAAIDAYDVHRAMVADLSAALLARNLSIGVVKEQAAVADIARFPTILPN